MGSISPLFDKMLAIHNKHGPFELALCVGDFFGPLLGDNDSDDVGRLLGGELRGKSAVVTTAEGLRIACIGGTYKAAVYSGSEIPHGFSSPYYTSQTVSKLLSNTVSSRVDSPSLSSIASSVVSSPLIDVLVSHDWPSLITNFSAVPLPSTELSNTGSPPIDDIIMKTKPRYIFCSGGGKPASFWEREPFTWEDEPDRVSRFIGLGAFGGDPVDGRKQRWFYAFVIRPQVQTTAESHRPANATLNPFVDIPRAYKRPLTSVEDEASEWGSVQRPWKRNYKGLCSDCHLFPHYLKTSPVGGEQGKPAPGHFLRDCPTKHVVGDTGGRKPREGYVCRACGSELHYIEDCPVIKDRRARDEHSNYQRRAREVGPDECWFCLSNPALVKHLIVAVGGECYLTFPKGQLVPTHSIDQREKSDDFKVPGGGHVLIVPIAHVATLDLIPGELRAYQAALRALYAKHGATAVFFEVGRVSSKGGHAHIQAIPVPLSLENRVESAFRDEGRLHGIEFDAEDAGAPSDDGGEGYFRVELPSGRRLVHQMRRGLPFSVQFGSASFTAESGGADRLEELSPVRGG
ncbi:nuclear protein [Russula emetica]|nr:nuclear protein [Russula emetica]